LRTGWPDAILDAQVDEHERSQDAAYRNEDRRRAPSSAATREEIIMSRLRHLMRLGAFVLSCGVESHAVAGSHTAPPPLRIDPLVEQFMAGSSIESARVSPDGQHIAAVAVAGPSHLIFLVDATTHAARILSLPRAGVLQQRWSTPLSVMYEPYQVAWTDDQHVAINFFVRRFERANHWSAYGEIVDLDGKVTRKLQQGLLSIQRDGTGKPTGWVLVHSGNPGRYVDQLNIESGESRAYNFSPPGMQQLRHTVLDAKGDILAAVTVDSAVLSDSSRETIWYRRDVDSSWQKVDERSVNDVQMQPAGVSNQPGHLVVLARNGADKQAVWDYDVDRQAFGEQLAIDAQDDIASFDSDPGDATVRWYVTGGLKRRIIWLDPDMSKLQADVDGALPDRVNLLSTSSPDSVAIWSRSDVDPGTLFMLDLKTLQMRSLLKSRPEIDSKRMQPMQGMHYASTDGLEIPAYLTLPGKPSRPAPLVVLVHGGPFARDDWGWSEDVQVLAAHGYAVLQPQFRGSTGFGMHFKQAGYRQWGRGMQDDVSAGVRDLIERKVVDPERVCIVGTSYGGYAALWGLASTPELYKCGVDTSGVSDIQDWVTNESAGSSSNEARAIWQLLLGDRTQMREAWAQVSPRLHPERIHAPLLIVHGNEDVIVPISHGEKMRDILEDQHGDVEWLMFDAEGHGVHIDNDRRIWYGAILDLFARTIGEGEPPVPPSDKMIADAKIRAEANKLQVRLPRAPAPMATVAPTASAPQ
jgi:dipeptidyl aminopeptidase/acylaminoacyl peptidase